MDFEENKITLDVVFHKSLWFNHLKSVEEIDTGSLLTMLFTHISIVEKLAQGILAAGKYNKN
ncbi:MAG: hypothetical protein IJI84_01205 [Clostridia bacterium]|nr:hypothetical protein [Clostridia bacterium]